MNRGYAAGVLAILGVAVMSARAGDVWNEKDWKQWTKEEVKLLLHDSPWCKRWAKGQSTTSAALPSASGAAREGAAGEDAPEIDYYLQVRSALPVREAIIRQFQFDDNYDSLTDAQKKTFDDAAALFLNRKYDDVIVVHVLYSSNIQEFERQLAEYWQSTPPEKVPNEVYLINEHGDRIAPIHFISSRGGAYEFELTFPRTKKGEPVIHEGDKTFQIEFRNPAVGRQATNAPGGATTSAPGGGGGAAARNRSSGGVPRNPPLAPPAGASTNPRNPAVPNFKAERVLIEFNLESMVWKGKLTY